MHYFGMSSVKAMLTTNTLSSSGSIDDRWKTLKHAVERIIDCYVMVNELKTDANKTDTSETMEISASDSNPHVARIAAEHNYLSENATSLQSIRRGPRKRKLPQWLSDAPTASHAVKKRSPDGVFNYASAVLNDGLLLLEIRDAIREGDGPRVIRCWKFMLLHWRHAKHTKYSLEALHLLSAVNATATKRIAHELTWCRFINTRGVPGGNIPVDLFMEHLNRTLKDYLLGLGANVSEATIIQTTLRNLMEVTSHFDKICGIHNDSMYHTSKRDEKDLDILLEELTLKSHVFDYVPGRFHKSFRNIKRHISDHINVDKLIDWIKKNQSKLSSQMKLRNILHRSRSDATHC